MNICPRCNLEKPRVYPNRRICRECENKRIRERNLKNGKTKKPRGEPINDLTGRKFGKLTVVKSNRIENKRIRYWDCVCECGNSTVVRHGNLTHGCVRSCGCMHARSGKLSSHWTGYGDISGHYWDKIKAHAKFRNQEVQVTIEEIWEVFLKQNGHCALSGLEISFSHNGRNQTASIDRIDNRLGYVPGNIQWVHKDVNRMKNHFSDDYFIAVCEKVANRKKTI